MNSIQFYTVPNSPPSNIQTISTTNTIRVSWQPIPPADANGNITGYLVFYRPVLSSGETYNVVATSDMSVELVDLAPGTKYAIRVLGSNAFGNGVSSLLMYTSTKVAGNYTHSYNI